MTADRADFGGRSEDPCDSLSSCSDEELVERCRGGRLSVPAASELIYRYFGFIKSKAASMCGSASACDDFVQEGVLGFLGAIRHYSSDKGTAFSSYAYSCVVNRMKTAAAKLSRLQSTEEGSDEDKGEDNLTPENIIIQRELFRELEDTLSPMEYEIFRLSITGLTSEEIAKKLTISVKSAENAVSRARRKLKGKIADEK